MSNASNVDSILQLGITAAKAGDKITARNMLRKVTEQDQYNEEGWYWLAQVVDSVDEKKVALGNVVVINPNNKKAQAQLDALTGNVRDERKSVNPVRSPRSQDLSAAPTGSLTDRFRALPPNTQLLTIGGIVGGIVLLLVIFAISSRNSSIDPANDVPTVAQIAENPTETPLPPTATITPTPQFSLTPTFDRRPVATWTATPAGGVPGATGTPLAGAPAGTLTGRMIANVGVIVTLDETLPIAVIDPNNGNVGIIIEDSERGTEAQLSPSLEEVTYSRFFQGTETFLMQTNPITGGRGRLINDLLDKNAPIADQKTLSLSYSGRILAFSGTATRDFDATSDIFYIRLGETAPQVFPPYDPNLPPEQQPTPAPPSTTVPLIRLTAKESGVNAHPAMAPDDGQMAFISDRSEEGRGVDMYIQPLFEGSTETNLTKDGDAIVESNPNWSPNGNFIAFQGRPDGKEVNNIYIIDQSGTLRYTIVEDAFDNINPVWSPDSKYIAFSSNRTGLYQIYVIDIETRVTYQVTQNQEPVYLNDWRAAAVTQ